MCSVLCVLCCVFCVMCSVLCVLCYVFCVMCSVLCVLCYVFCVMCSVLCVLSSVSGLMLIKCASQFLIRIHSLHSGPVVTKFIRVIFTSADQQLKNTETQLLNVSFKGRFTHSMPCPCRARAIPLPSRAAKGLKCVFPFWFIQCGRVWFTLTMPCSDHAVLLKATAQHGRRETTVLWPWEEWHDRSMA